MSGAGEQQLQSATAQHPDTGGGMADARGGRDTNSGIPGGLNIEYGSLWAAPGKTSPRINSSSVSPSTG